MAQNTWLAVVKINRPVVNRLRHLLLLRFSRRLARVWVMVLEDHDVGAALV